MSVSHSSLKRASARFPSSPIRLAVRIPRWSDNSPGERAVGSKPLNFSRPGPYLLLPGVRLEHEGLPELKMIAWTCIWRAMREIVRPPEAVWQKLADKRLADPTRVLAVFAFPRMTMPA